MQNTKSVLKLCSLEDIEFISNSVKLRPILMIFIWQIVLTVSFILVKKTVFVTIKEAEIHQKQKVS